MSQNGGLAEWNGVLPSVVQFPPASGKGSSEVWVVKCRLCNGVTLESRTTWQQHFESKRHRNAARQQGLTPTGHRLDGKNAAAAPAEGGGGKQQQQQQAGAPVGGPPVPRSKVSPTAATATPVTKNNTGGKSGEFDIAKSIASQVGKGGQAPVAAGPQGGKTIMPRPSNNNAAGGGQQQGGWANPPTSVTSSAATKSGKQQQQQQQQQQPAQPQQSAKKATNNNNTNHTNNANNSNSSLPASGAASRQPSSVLLAENVVNRDRVRSANGTPAPGGDDAAALSPVASVAPPPPIQVVRATVGAPIVDPALDRANGRTLAFLASNPVVRGTPAAAPSASMPEHFKVTARLPTTLYRLLVPRGDDIEAMRAPGVAGTTDTVKAFREAFHELATELGGFEPDPDAPGVTLLTANRAVPVAVMRMAESFFNAAVCFAPYDEPAGSTATATAARVDTASFWS
jgi:hypothetical protein